MNSLKATFGLLNSNSIPYNALAKDAFSRQGKRSLKKLAAYLELDEYDVRFNRGGIAVSGECILHGMKNGLGVYIHIAQCIGGKGPAVFIRECKGMKDFYGGRNVKITNLFNGHKEGYAFDAEVLNLINQAKTILGYED